MASDKGQGKRRRTTDSAEGSRRLPQGVFQPFPKIPATPTWVQKKKKLAWPQGNALATLKIIIRRRQRKGFPVSHQGVREVSFFLSYSIWIDVQGQRWSSPNGARARSLEGSTQELGGCFATPSHSGVCTAQSVSCPWISWYWGFLLISRFSISFIKRCVKYTLTCL